MVLHSHRGPVSLPWGTSKQGSARAWEGKRLSLSLQICALCCTSNGVYVHRAISCVSTKLQTPNPNCAWSSIIVGCGFYHVLCDPRTYRYTVHLRVRLLMDQLDPGFLCIVPIHCSVSLGAAGSWERQTQFECILSLSSGEACAGKILDFLEEGLHYRRRRVLWLCSISTSEVDNYG